MKRIGSIFIFAAAMVSLAHATEPTTTPVAAIDPLTLVQRANDDAVSRLYAQIAAETVGGVAVAQMIERVDGFKTVMDGLAKAEQIGGPRVVGDEIVQVQLQISGPRAAQLVLQAVAVKPEKSPIAVDRLAFLLQDWNHRVFSSTGASVEPSRAEVMPFDVQVTKTTTNASQPKHAADATVDAPPTWMSDPISTQATANRDGSSLRTARVAEQSARDALHKAIYALALGERSTVGELCSSDDAIAKAVDEVVQGAKIFGVDYHADGSVEVRISLEGRQLWQAILATR